MNKLKAFQLKFFSPYYFSLIALFGVNWKFTLWNWLNSSDREISLSRVRAGLTKLAQEVVDTIDLRGHNRMYFAHWPQCTVTLNSNFAILKTWNYSIRIKEFFEPIVCEKKGDGFLLFLTAFSWETDLWETLSDFTVKNAKLGRDICI